MEEEDLYDEFGNYIGKDLEDQVKKKERNILN
jgi:hypothetical protein